MNSYRFYSTSQTAFWRDINYWCESNQQNNRNPFWCVNKQHGQIFVTEHLKKKNFLFPLKSCTSTSLSFDLCVFSLNHFAFTIRYSFTFIQSIIQYYVDMFWFLNQQWSHSFEKRFYLSSCTFFHSCACVRVRSLASLLVIRKEREIERKRNNQYMSMSICCHRERSNQTNTNHVLCVAVHIDVSSVTLYVFSSLVLATSVRLLYCCYDDIYAVSHFFFVSVIVAVVV